MNKLMLWGAMLVLAQNTYAQELVREEVYAVNTADQSLSLAAVQQQTNTQPDPDDDQSGTIKKYSRTFSADRQDKISVTNQYGSVVVKTWNRKEVRLDASIRASNSQDHRGSRLIDQVNINADKSTDQISFRTVIGQEQKRWGRNNNKAREIRVDYVIYLPASNALSISNQYGNVQIEDFAGALSLKLQYGDFSAGNLSSDNNYISVQYGKTNIVEANKLTVKQQYGSGLSIGTVGTLDLNIQYAGVKITRVSGDAVIRQQYGSGLELGSVGNLVLNAQYANVRVGDIRGNARVDQQYNTLNITNVGNLDLKSQYSGVNVGTLRGDGNFNMDYNNLNIQQVLASSRNLTVTSTYLGIKIGFAGNYNGDFTVRQSYGSFKSGERVHTNTDGDEESRRGSSRSYNGRIGNGRTSNIRISSTYGNLNFN